MYHFTVVSCFIILGAHVTSSLARFIQNVHQNNYRNTTSLPDGISTQEMADAFPPRDAANITNWFGTSLYGWDKCDDLSPLFKGWIKEAYTDANILANQDGVKANIDWDSAAAFEFLGPSALNKNQQPQIQAVLANMATVKDGSSLWTPNWIRARCDDPKFLCSTDCPQPGQPQPGTLLAYARNPGNNGNNEQYPDINFCPSFFARRNLGNAMAYGSGQRNPKDKFNLDNSISRADALLHELFHLDLAANSVNENPNPHIRDLKILLLENGKKTGWVKAYGTKLPKVLARFVPKTSTSVQTGYFVQRNADNFIGFTLAKYVQAALGQYPFIPAVYDGIGDIPVLPPDRGDINSIVYVSNGTNPAIFDTDDGSIPGSPGDLSIGGTCPVIQSTDEGVAEDLEIGGPVPPEMIPADYANERFKFLSSLIGINNSSPSLPPSPPPTPSAAMCSMDVVENWTCEESTTNLYALVSIKDSHGTPDYISSQSANSPGQSINDGNPLSIKNGSMQYYMRITGEHQNDYIQFNYGGLAWRSDSTDGTATCKPNGKDWNPKGPQACPIGPPQTRAFTCQYPC